MRLTISTETQSFTADLPEFECGEQFRKMVGNLISATKNEQQCPQVENPVAVPVTKRIETVASVLKNPFSAPRPATRKQETGQASYKGFMHIKCPHCGVVRGFYAKTEISSYHCNACNITSDLPFGLVPLYENCECGKSFKYLTNIKEAMFDIPCLDCGNPVAVQYNSKLDKYETIGRQLRKKRRDMV